MSEGNERKARKRSFLIEEALEEYIEKEARKRGKKGKKDE